MLNILGHEENVNQNLRFFLIPVKMVIINNTNNSNFWQGWEDKWTLLHCWWESKLIKHYGKQYRGPWKTKNRILYNPAISNLVIYPKECTVAYDRATSTPMFIATLFTTAKLSKQPRCIEKMCWNSIHPYRRMKLCCLQANGWNWRTSC
jgi:hypothetical protein